MSAVIRVYNAAGNVIETQEHAHALRIAFRDQIYNGCPLAHARRVTGF
jgi:hypothetical protein